MLTSAMCFLYLSMRPKLPEPKPDAAQKAAQNADPLLRDATPNARQAANATGSDASESGIEPPAYPSRAITLGSMDPAQGYNLQVTLTTRGAGIEQAELVGQTAPGKFRFRALEHEGGYLGYLGLAETPDGLLIRTVPRGTPASQATSPGHAPGLQVHDVLTEIQGLAVNSLESVDQALTKTKKGQTVELKVRRTVSGSESELTFQATLSEAPLDILRSDERSSEQVVGNLSRTSLRTTLASIDSTRIPVGQSVLPALRATLEADWQAVPLEVAGGEGIEFRLPLESFLEGTGRPEKLDLVKRYRLLPESDKSDGYILDLETTIVNRNDANVNISFRQEGLAGLSLEGWWYSVKISPYMFSGAGQRDTIYNSDQDGHGLLTTRQIQSNALKVPAQPDRLIFSENEPEPARNLNYVGIDSQYFNASILPHPDAPDSLKGLRTAAATAVAIAPDIKKAQAQATNVSFWFDTNEKTIPAGEQLSQRYQIFVGPKDSQLLANHELESAIEYGWFPWIAKPLSAILHFFHMLTRNYAVAIVMLTVMVRGLMFPLGRRTLLSSQRMQEKMKVLQPEMKKINEKYKDNLEKRTKAMQELYAKHNFNPTEQLTGCLPMFIQVPIFIGLYRCLSVDISLRQEPLLQGLPWCSNLAGPDMLFAWGSWMPEFIAGRGVGWLGPYFNILPMVTVALFLAQQKILMPKATDDQTRMTQNVMQVMTVFMGVLFFKVPSGLCIYFITSSLWSLIERKLVKKLTPAQSSTETAPAVETNNDAPTTKNRGKSARNRTQPEEKPKNGKLQELMQMLEKPAVKSATQRGTAKTQRGPAKTPTSKAGRGGRKKDKKRRR